MRDVMETAAKTPEKLVPIRVEVDTDTVRIRDCFTWNINGRGGRNLMSFETDLASNLNQRA
jgi:hypothetical protein